MPNFLQEDTLIAQNFFLEIKGEVITYLSGVSGLDIAMEVAEVVQAAPNGKKVIRKMLGTHIKPPDLSLTRVAPTDMSKDAMWGWFNKIYQKGMPVGDRESERKDGSIVIYDSTGAEVARFNFFNGWPSKISTDQLSVDSNDPVKETITLTIERLERTK
jgi:phage tail-like protein